MAKKRVRVRIKKSKRVVGKKTNRAPVFVVIFYMTVISVLLSLVIAKCPSQIFVEDQTGQWPRREKEMQVTIFAGPTSYQFHAMESLTLLHENGTEYPVNAKDVWKGMQVMLGGKFRYVIKVRA